MAETVIEPASGWKALGLRELWAFRDLTLLLGWRDIQVRYRQTFLGVAWVLLQPLALMMVFTLVLGRMGGEVAGGVPYPLRVVSGFLLWNLFTGVVSRSAGSVVESERLITKIYFPRLVIPIASAASAVVDFVVSCLLLIPLMLWYGQVPSWSVLLLPVLGILTVLLGLGVGIVMAAGSVTYRDVRYIFPFLLQLWLFATPAVYFPTSLDVQGIGLLDLNPVGGLVAAFQAALFSAAIPWERLGFSAAASAILFILGCLYFRRVEDNFADTI
jgi:lipopolysaccharide transport system permease protein